MDGVKQKRTVKSRAHSVEEKRLQKKRWRKRQKEKKRLARRQSNELAETQTVQKCSSVQERQRELKEPKEGHSEPKSTECGTSRGRLMVNLARASRKRLYEDQAASTTAARRDNGTPGKKAMIEKPTDLKVLDSKLLNYKSDKPVGSGTYGDCFLASYKGIDVVVKQMKGEDSDKTKRDVIREGKMIMALGDHEGLPLLFGVVTHNEPYGLVFKFHDVGGESLTLSHAGNMKLLTERQCLNVFVNVCSVVGHIHSRGYIHNDLKGNNIILVKRDSEYFPIVIDFGKSRKKDNPEMRRRRSTAGNSYIAPEVIEGGKQTTASDVYSLGHLFKAMAVHFGREFCRSIRNIAKKATAPDAIARPTVTEVKQMLESV